MYKFIKDNFGFSHWPPNEPPLSIQSSESYTQFGTEKTSSNLSLNREEHPVSLPPATQTTGTDLLPSRAASSLPRNVGRKAYAFGANRSATLPNKKDLKLAAYFSSGELEPLKDYVTDLTTSYESIVSSEGTFTRAGPRVAECTVELEEQAHGALSEIKDLTEHREALENARALECDQVRYLSRFLQSNHELKIEILNLRTRYLSIKFAFLNGMLEKLAALDPNAIAPSYLRMRTFNDWLKHSSIIDDINDKMLRARTKKVRLKRMFLNSYFKDTGVLHNCDPRPDFGSFKRFSIRLQSVSQEMAFMKSDIDNIQQQLTQILRTNEEACSFDVLASLLRDRKSFENRKIDEYVKECLECAPVEDRADEWTSILVFEDNCPEPYSESIPGANPSRYQEYVRALTQYICDKLKHAGATVDPIKVFGALEQRILPRVFTQAMTTVTKPNLDGFIYDKCKRLSGYTQAQIGVPERFIQNCPLPYYSAISRLKSIVFSLTPTKIMQAISYTANDIHQRMMEQCADSAVGADAFLPIWVFCIIRANVPNLATLVNFLKGYLNPDLRYCEIGYYVTCLEGACVYIQELEEVDYTSEKRYFVFDTERYRTILQDKQMFRYVEDRSITGYQLYLRPELIDKKHVLYKCALVQTGLEDDVVHGGVVALGTQLNNVQMEHFQQNTPNMNMVAIDGEMMSVMVAKVSHQVEMEADNEEEMAFEDNNEEEEEEEEQQKTEGQGEGIVEPILSVVRRLRRLSTAAYDLMISDSVAPDPTPEEEDVVGDGGWWHIREGSFAQIRDKVLTVSSLTRLGVWSKEERDELIERIAAGKITALPESAYARIAIKYGFYLKNEAGVKRFLCEVQLLLRHLNYQSVFADIDGVLSDLTSTAILNFQKHLNQGGEYVEKLPETGVLCKDTYDRLRDKLKRILMDLKKLGYQLPFNCLLQPNEQRMIQFITKIQEHFGLGLYIRGSFCGKTIEAINRHMYQSEVAAWFPPFSNALSSDTLHSEKVSSNSSSVVIANSLNRTEPCHNTFLPGL